ncbi:hypothetical protein XBI1_400013 [Xenorhabdus bovienii str. Intermedium]|uniref:Uncharacterized protein n=1 Tax=Xenorhabdus bovienii str. Intermedium TaxID=1379677 RepID=A0A077QMT3_XENBV|nr:hypothetical protein XBI1_400013 [Xenorhabdus bovienii str. Intermedium]
MLAKNAHVGIQNMLTQLYEIKKGGCNLNHNKNQKIKTIITFSMIDSLTHSQKEHPGKTSVKTAHT